MGILVPSFRRDEVEGTDKDERARDVEGRNGQDGGCITHKMHGRGKVTSTVTMVPYIRWFIPDLSRGESRRCYWPTNQEGGGAGLCSYTAIGNYLTTLESWTMGEGP